MSFLLASPGDVPELLILVGFVGLYRLFMAGVLVVTLALTALCAIDALVARRRNRRPE